MCLTWLLGFKVAIISLNGRWLDATGVAKPDDPDPSIAGNLSRDIRNTIAPLESVAGHPLLSSLDSVTVQHAAMPRFSRSQKHSEVKYRLPLSHALLSL
jgi:hypothetical protein